MPVSVLSNNAGSATLGRGWRESCRQAVFQRTYKVLNAGRALAVSLCRDLFAELKTLGSRHRAYERKQRGSTSGPQEEDLLRLSRHQGTCPAPRHRHLCLCRSASCDQLQRMQSCASEVLGALQGRRDNCVALHGSPWLGSYHAHSWACWASLTRSRTGPESEQCQRLIESHKECLRKEGFSVRPALPAALARAEDQG